MSPEQIRKILETPFWISTLSPGSAYIRIHDDHDGTFRGRIVVRFDDMGDAWFFTDNQEYLRFRTPAGGGNSPRTRTALMILAEAIRLDNEERPIERPPRNEV